MIIRSTVEVRPETLPSEAKQLAERDSGWPAIVQPAAQVKELTRLNGDPAPADIEDAKPLIIPGSQLLEHLDPQTKDAVQAGLKELLQQTGSDSENDPQALAIAVRVARPMSTDGSASGEAGKASKKLGEIQLKAMSDVVGIMASAAHPLGGSMLQSALVAYDAGDWMKRVAQGQESTRELAADAALTATDAAAVVMSQFPSLRNWGLVVKGISTIVRYGKEHYKLIDAELEPEDEDFEIALSQVSACTFKAQETQ